MDHYSVAHLLQEHKNLVNYFSTPQQEALRIGGCLFSKNIILTHPKVYRYKLYPSMSAIS